jgi:hypothetical protein
VVVRVLPEDAVVLFVDADRVRDRQRLARPGVRDAVRYAISPTQSQPSVNEFALETDSDCYLEFRVYAYVDISWG